MLGRILLFFFLYLPFQLAINPAEGIDLASIRIIIPLIFFIWIIEGLVKKRIILSSRMESWLIVSFVATSAFTIFWAENPIWGVRKILFILSIVPLYFLIIDLLSKNPGWIKKLMGWVVIGGSFSALIGIFQFFLQFSLGIDPAIRLWSLAIVPFLGDSFSQSVIEHSSWLVNIGGKTVFRSVSFFPDPHIFAFYLNLIIPWSLFLLLSAQKRKLFWGISTGLLITALLTTFSRGGYLGLIMILVIFFFYHFGKKAGNKKFLIAPMVMGLLIASIIIIPNPFSQRLKNSFSLDEGSNQGRLSIWKESIGIIGEHPMGVGIGNYPLAIKPSADYREPIYAHNLYLDIAAETGAVNAIIFILILFFSGLSFWKKSKNESFYFAGVLSIAGFSIHAFFDTPLYSVHILPLLLTMLAISSAYEKK